MAAHMLPFEKVTPIVGGPGVFESEVVCEKKGFVALSRNDLLVILVATWGAGLLIIFVILFSMAFTFLRRM